MGFQEAVQSAIISVIGAVSKAIRESLRPLLKPFEGILLDTPHSPNTEGMYMNLPEYCEPSYRCDEFMQGVYPKMYELVWNGTGDMMSIISLSIFVLAIGWVVTGAFVGLTSMANRSDMSRVNRRAVVALFIGIPMWWSAWNMAAEFTDRFVSIVSGGGFIGVLTTSPGGGGVATILMLILYTIGLLPLFMFIVVLTIRVIVIQLYAAFGPLLIAFWVFDTGPLSSLGQFAGKYLKMGPAVLFSLVPTALLLRFSGMMMEAMASGKPSFVGYILSIVTFFLAAIMPIKVMENAGATSSRGKAKMAAKVATGAAGSGVGALSSANSKFTTAGKKVKQGAQTAQTTLGDFGEDSSQSGGLGRVTSTAKGLYDEHTNEDGYFNTDYMPSKGQAETVSKEHGKRRVARTANTAIASKRYGEKMAGAGASASRTLSGAGSALASSALSKVPSPNNVSVEHEPGELDTVPEQEQQPEASDANPDYSMGDEGFSIEDPAEEGAESTEEPEELFIGRPTEQGETAPNAQPSGSDSTSDSQSRLTDAETKDDPELMGTELTALPNPDKHEMVENNGRATGDKTKEPGQTDITDW